MTTNSHGSFPTPVRLEVFDQDDYRCRICGQGWIEKGGTARLEAHHIEDNPEDIEYHDPDNGTTLCEVCHHYITTRIPDDLPFKTTTLQEDLKLLPHDFEIISTLARRGPASVQEIMADIDDNKSYMATRERLWHLMGHDRRIDRLTHPLVDQCADTGKWGLPHQIDRTARGRFPSDTDKLIKRFEDELVRRLLNYGIERGRVAADLGVHERTTHYKQKRAQAYRLPIGDESPDSTPEEQQANSEFQTLASFLTDADQSQDEHPGRGDGEDAHTTPKVSKLESELPELLSKLERLIAHLTTETSTETETTELANRIAERTD